jgi:hypothetical protein
MSSPTIHEPRKHKFSGKRHPCPECGSRRGFAHADGRTDRGKCFGCGGWIAPDAIPKPDSSILITRQGRVINLSMKESTK